MIKEFKLFVWDVSPTIIELGPIKLRYYGLLFASMLMGGFYLFRWQVLRGGYTEKQADRFLLLGVLGIVIGARLGHVLFYEPGRYLSNPLEILKIWKGGLASHGGTIGVLFACYLYARSENIKVREIFDRITFSAALAATAVRIGNFFNSEIVGRVTDVPWAIKFPRGYQDAGLPLELIPARHPSQLYETMLGLFVLLTIYLIDRKFKEDRPLGLLFGTFAILYFGGRFFIEFFKEYQTVSAGSSMLTMGQYLSVPFFAIGIYFTYQAIKNPVLTSTFRPALPKKRGAAPKKKKRKDRA
jgi:phosphatidylglycerol---prolipoprotein diacylglyceryl transferase